MKITLHNGKIIKFPKDKDDDGPYYKHNTVIFYIKDKLDASEKELALSLERERNILLDFKLVKSELAHALAYFEIGS